MLISQTAWSGHCVWLVYKSGDFLGWFFGRKRLTYTQVNTVQQISKKKYQELLVSSVKLGIMLMSQ